MSYVRYTDKKGKEWTCTAEEWALIQEREKRYKKKLFTYIGPFAPVTVEHIPPPTRSKDVQMPEEIRRVTGSEPKQGAATSPRKQKAAN